MKLAFENEMGGGRRLFSQAENSSIGISVGGVLGNQNLIVGNKRLGIGFFAGIHKENDIGINGTRAIGQLF